MMQNHELDKQILEVETKLARLKELQAGLERLPADKKLAMILHSKFCRINHTDGCSWGYEEEATYPGGTWKGHAHARYRTKAQMLLREFPDVSTDNLIKIATIITDY